MKLYTVTATFMVVGKDDEDVKRNLNVLDVDFHDLNNVKIKPADVCLPGWESWFPYTTDIDTLEKNCLEWAKEMRRGKP